MANPEHVERLKEGVDSWNQWREENPRIDINLSGVDLTYADLREFDLSKVNLEDARLFVADLRGGNLAGADLQNAYFLESFIQGANLRGVSAIQTDFREADLRRANLYRANMFRADLRGADLGSATLELAGLTGANLQHANLRDTDLHGAFLGDTVFGYNDLSRTKGLGDCHHQGASPFDSLTLAWSPNLPLSFLQGIGLKDWEIETLELHKPGIEPHELERILNNIRSHYNPDPIAFQSVFISFTEANRPFAEKLFESLQSKGVRTWFAPERLKGGDFLDEQLDRAIQVQDRLLVCLSDASIKSKWVQHEMARAFKREQKEKRRILFPIRLCSYEALQDWSLVTDADPLNDIADRIRRYYIPDFSDEGNFGREFEKLLDALRESAEPQSQ